MNKTNSTRYRGTRTVRMSFRVSPRTKRQFKSMAMLFDTSQTEVMRLAAESLNEIAAALGVHTPKELTVAVDRLLRQGEQAGETREASNES